MFKKIAQTMAVCLCVAVMAAGCASMKKVSDEEMIQTDRKSVV